VNWKLIVAITLLATTQAVQADGTYVGLIRLAHFGILYLDVSATQMSNRPPCATRNYVHLQESPTDAAYKEKFSILLSAWIAEKPLILQGTGSCTSEGDEIISIVRFP
jgi:hypothetical protein